MTYSIHYVQKLLEEDFVKANPLWVAELELMLKTKEKAEIQVGRRSRWAAERGGW